MDFVLRTLPKNGSGRHKMSGTVLDRAPSYVVKYILDQILKYVPSPDFQSAFKVLLLWQLSLALFLPQLPSQCRLSPSD
jgi:hypothetical protein